MTALEIFIFACKNDLQEKDIYEVISKFKDSLVQNSKDIIKGLNNKDVPLCCKQEWSTEDVLELFKG